MNNYHFDTYDIENHNKFWKLRELEIIFSKYDNHFLSAFNNYMKENGYIAGQYGLPEECYHINIIYFSRQGTFQRKILRIHPNGVNEIYDNLLNFAKIAAFA